jgi:hypothetical protein
MRFETKSIDAIADGINWVLTSSFLICNSVRRLILSAFRKTEQNSVFTKQEQKKYEQKKSNRRRRSRTEEVVDRLQVVGEVDRFRRFSLSDPSLRSDGCRSEDENLLPSQGSPFPANNAGP